MIRSLIDLLRITKKLSSKNGLEWYRYIHTHSISGYLVLRLLPLHGLLHHLPRCPSPGSQYPPKLSLPTPPTTKPSPPHPSRCTTTSNLLWSNVFFFIFLFFSKSHSVVFYNFTLFTELYSSWGSRPDHNFRPKKYHFLFLPSFDAEAFKTCKNTIKLIICELYPGLGC